jgi:hypothetical protein
MHATAHLIGKTFVTQKLQKQHDNLCCVKQIPHLHRSSAYAGM